MNNALYCRTCEKETITEYREDTCPACGSHDVFNSRFTKCHCGELVYLTRFTNECWECGQLYNNSGQELLPMEMWEEEY